MTAYIPLGVTDPSDSSAIPSFINRNQSQTKIEDVVKAITKARRIVVVTGAGISVQAGIPDFRSPSGLFQSLKRDNPREGLTSGKDLFNASVFGSEQTSSLFYQMIAKLSDLSVNAEPTAFHSLLRTLDQRGQLLRLYTQNIDGLEEKAGISFGVPEFMDRPRNKRPRLDEEPVPDCSPKQGVVPKCVPLHGTLQHMHCSRCSYSETITPYVDTLRAGSAPLCPACTSAEETRGLVGKRPRGIGRLRPSVVLYGEEHREGERVGAVVQRDLTGKGKGNRCGDLLIVAGTSLRVPGTKRIVREFSKSVKLSHSSSRGMAFGESGLSLSQLPTPAPSPRRTPDQSSPEEPSVVRTIFVNYELPAPSREWEGVFDIWVKGDAQTFAELVSEAIQTKEEQRMKKRKVFSKGIDRDATCGLPSPSATPKKKRKQLDDGSPSVDRRKERMKKHTSDSDRLSSQTRIELGNLDSNEATSLYSWLLEPARTLSIRTTPMTSFIRSTAQMDDDSEDYSSSPSIELPPSPSFGFRPKLLPSPPLTPAMKYLTLPR